MFTKKNLYQAGQQLALITALSLGMMTMPAYASTHNNLPNLYLLINNNTDYPMHLDQATIQPHQMLGYQYSINNIKPMTVITHDQKYQLTIDVTKLNNYKSNRDIDNGELEIIIGPQSNDDQSMSCYVTQYEFDLLNETEHAGSTTFNDFIEGFNEWHNEFLTKIT